MKYEKAEKYFWLLVQCDLSSYYSVILVITLYFFKFLVQVELFPEFASFSFYCILLFNVEMSSLA